MAAFITLPAAVPRAVSVGGLTLQFYEILLLLAASALLFAGRTNRATDVTAVAGLSLLAVGVGLSFLARMPASAIIFETRRLVILFVAVFVAGRVYGLITARWLNTVVFTLWFSAALTVTASLTGLDLGQRVLAASLEYGDASAAARLVTDATYLGVAVLTVGICLYLIGRLPRRLWLTLLLPATVIVLLSFSRNPLLSLAAGVVVAIIHSPSAAAMGRAIRLIVIATAGILAAWVVALFDQSGMAAQWLSSQMSGFSDRVIGGLTASGLASDDSALYRSEQEDPFLWRAFWASPVVGHGFGFEYKPAFTGRSYVTPELATQASRYAHNFYLWLMAKSGIVGLIAFFALAIRPAFLALKRSTPHFVVALAAALLGMLIQSWVAPMPAGSPTSLLFGILLGLVAAGVARSRVPGRTRQPRNERARASRNVPSPNS